jgi:microcystin-dependent protein
MAEVRIVGFNFPPKGWAECNGQLIPISQNTALFALLGTFYGGDGKSTFALPNIQNSAVIGVGQGSGLSPRFQGEIGGSESVTLQVSEMPVHNHTLMSNVQPATLATPDNTSVFGRSSGGNVFRSGAGNVTMAPQTLTPSGASLPHNNMMPFLTLRYVIAMQGVFPQRP